MPAVAQAIKAKNAIDARKISEMLQITFCIVFLISQILFLPIKKIVQVSLI
jgi:hypothetical protein